MRFVAVFFAMALCFPALAQEEEAALWYVHFDQVMPDMEDAYVEAAKGWVDAFTKADMGPDWTFVTSSSDDFTYITGWQLKNYAQLDAMEELEGIMVEKIGAETLKGLMDSQTKAVHSHHSGIVKHLPALSYRPAKSMLTKAVPGYSRVGVHHVKPGKDEDFKKTITTLKEALAKVEHGLGFETFKVEFGIGSYVMIWSADDAGQFFTNNVMRDVLPKAMGPEASFQLYTQWRSSITAFESHDNRPRPELSYVPQPAATAETAPAAEEKSE